MRKSIVIPVVAIAIIASLGGCVALKPDPIDNTDIETYGKLTAEKQPTATPATRDAGIERWKALLADFSAENIEGKVTEVYAEETFFNDTLKTIRSAAELEVYLVETAEMLQYGRVTYEDVAISGDEVYVRWHMVFRSKKLRKEEDIITIGMSHLRFDADGKIVLHQDFWDTSRGLFEHVPVLGSGIRTIKKRL